MFGFLRSVAEHSESEADQYSNDQQSTVNSLLATRSRSELRPRRGYVGSRVNNRINNVRALEGVDVDENDTTLSSLLDVDWKSYFCEQKDPEFWQDQLVPYQEPVVKQKLNRKDGSHLQSQIFQRQRHFEREARRIGKLRTVGHKHTEEEKEKHSNLRHVTSATQRTKVNVSFSGDRGEESDTVDTEYMSDDDEEGHSSDINGENSDSDLEVIPSSAEAHLCSYCIHNPYRGYLNDVKPPPALITLSHLPYLYGENALQTISNLPTKTVALLKKCYTTSFAKDIERVILSIKKGAAIVSKKKEVVEDVARDYPSQINTSAKVHNSYFKQCADNACQQNPASTKGYQAREDNLVDAEHLYLSTKQGLMFALKDKYALTIVLAMAQLHYLNVKIIQKESFTKTTAISLGNDQVIESSEDCLFATPHAAKEMGYPFLVFLSGNRGICTCEEKRLDEKYMEPCKTLDSTHQSHVYTPKHMDSLGIKDVRKLKRSEYTYVPAHAFTLADLFAQHTDQ